MVAWVVVGVGLMVMGLVGMGCGMYGFGVVWNFGCMLLWFGGGGCVGFGYDVGFVDRNVVV